MPRRCGCAGAAGDAGKVAAQKAEDNLVRVADQRHVEAIRHTGTTSNNTSSLAPERYNGSFTHIGDGEVEQRWNHPECAGLLPHRGSKPNTE